MEEIGQKPVVLNKEVNGFALNRLQYAVLGECFRFVLTLDLIHLSRMVQEGVLSPADVDTTLNCGLAPRWAIMGAFQTIDLNAPKGISFIINSPASPLTKFDLQKGLRIIAQDTWVD
jgi:L-gulonate 3-dehydrogenase